MPLLILLNFMCRVLPSHVMSNAALAFDTLMLDAYRELIGLSTTELNEAKYQIQWPIRNGGLGLTSYSQSHHSAYVASIAMAVPYLPVPAPPPPPPPPSSLAPESDYARRTRLHSQHGILQYSLDRLAEQGVPSSLVPTTVVGFFTTYNSGAPRKLQRDIYRRVLDYEIDCKTNGREPSGNYPRIQPMTHGQCIRIQSASSRAASYFLTQHSAHDSLFEIAVNDLIAAHRHRLGLPPQSNLILTSCPLCGRHGSRGDPSIPLPHDHFHSCQYLRGSGTTSRHNRILHVIGRLAREIGCAYWEEPRDIMPNSNNRSTRPDAIITTPTGRIMIDVSVINPTSESYISRRASAPQSSSSSSTSRQSKFTHERELIKIRKYADQARLEDCVFYPVVFETYGAVGRMATRFFVALADVYVTGYTGEQEEKLRTAWLRRAMAAMSFALQSGNGYMSYLGSSQARHDIMQSRRGPHHPISSSSPSSSPSSHQLLLPPSSPSSAGSPWPHLRHHSANNIPIIHRSRSSNSGNGASPAVVRSNSGGVRRSGRNGGRARGHHPLPPP